MAGDMLSPDEASRKKKRLQENMVVVAMAMVMDIDWYGDENGGNVLW